MIHRSATSLPQSSFQRSPHIRISQPLSVTEPESRVLLLDENTDSSSHRCDVMRRLRRYYTWTRAKEGRAAVGTDSELVTASRTERFRVIGVNPDAITGDGNRWLCITEPLHAAASCRAVRSCRLFDGAIEVDVSQPKDANKAHL
jgi:hypothetical protein